MDEIRIPDGSSAFGEGLYPELPWHQFEEGESAAIPMEVRLAQVVGHSDSPPGLPLLPNEEIELGQPDFEPIPEEVFELTKLRLIDIIITADKMDQWIDHGLAEIPKHLQPQLRALRQKIQDIGFILEDYQRLGKLPGSPNQ